MSRVIDLVPGCRVLSFRTGRPATFIAQTRHPLWPETQLVILVLDDGTWQHEALSPVAEVTLVEPDSRLGMIRNLQDIFGGTRRPRNTTRIELSEPQRTERVSFDG